jgi:hypothetical protein
MAWSCSRSPRIVEYVSRLKPNEPAVRAREWKGFGTSIDCVAAGHMPECDPLVPPFPRLVAAERAGHARVAAFEKIEDAFHKYFDPALGARISHHVI